MGNDSCTEQLHPCNEVVVRSEKAGFDAISETLPPHGGLVSIVQDPAPVLIAVSTATVRAPLLLSPQVESKYMPVAPVCAPA